MRQGLRRTNIPLPNSTEKFALPQDSGLRIDKIAIASRQNVRRKIVVRLDLLDDWAAKLVLLYQRDLWLECDFGNSGPHITTFFLTFPYNISIILGELAFTSRSCGLPHVCGTKILALSRLPIRLGAPYVADHDSA
jgi:hypothetical protein